MKWRVELDEEGDGEVVREEHGLTRRILLGLHNPEQTQAEAHVIASALNISEGIIENLRRGLRVRESAPPAVSGGSSGTPQ